MSKKTREKLGKLFTGNDMLEAEDLLVHQCADNLPFYEKADEYYMERIRFAVIKLSDGDLDALVRWIEEAMIDSRDVLVAAGFGLSVTAHEEWEP